MKFLRFKILKGFEPCECLKNLGCFTKFWIFFQIISLPSLPPFLPIDRQLMLAAGDSAGTLHILEIPWSLSHASSNEVSFKKIKLKYTHHNCTLYNYQLSEIDKLSCNIW